MSGLAFEVLVEGTAHRRAQALCREEIGALFAGRLQSLVRSSRAIVPVDSRSGEILGSEEASRCELDCERMRGDGVLLVRELSGAGERQG